MGTRTTDVRVRIGADMAELQARFAAGEISAKNLAAQMDRLQAKMLAFNAVEAAAYREAEQRNAARIASYGKVGSAVGAMGLAVGLGLGIATKAAMDWEAAFANVEKVVGRGAGTDVLEQQLRDLAKTLPVSAEQIAAVATSAGQLGVAKENLAAFTKVALELGSTTSMSAEDAATGLAKLGNVMDPQNFSANIDRAGSALLALGNYGASTEQQILDMAQRISGAGKIVGLTEPEVLAFSNALTSVGINAEEGGSAFSRVIELLDKATKSGGSDLTKFAEIAGMSGQQFAQEFGSKPAAAIQAFVAGLGRVQASGGDVFATLDALGLKNIRVTDVMLRATAATDLMAESVRRGTDAWTADNALTEAAAAKYQTASAKVEIAKNNLNDMAITLGQTFLPVVGDVSSKVSGMAKVFADLPGPAKTGIAALGGLAATALTVGGAALFMVPKVNSLLTALDDMGPRGAKAAGALRSVGSALAGPWGVALAAGTVALGLFLNAQAEAKQKVEELKATLDTQTGAITDNTRTWAANELQQSGAFDAAKKVGISLQTLTDAALGNADALKQVNAAIAGFDTTTSALSGSKASRPLDAQQQAARLLKDTLGDTNGTLVEAKSKWQDLQQATAQTSGTQASATHWVQDATGAITSQAAAADQAKQSITDFDQALKDLFDQELGVGSATDKAQSAINNLMTAYKDATTSKTTGGESKSQITTAAKAAGDKARVDALDLGKTKAQAAAAAKQASDAVKAAGGGGSTTTSTSVDVAKGTSDAAIKVRNAIRDVISADLDLLDEMRKQGSSQDQITAKSQAMAGQFDSLAGKFGLTKDQAKEYSDTLRQVPDTVATTFTTPGLATAVQSMDDLIARIGIVNGKQVAINVNAGSANVREGRTATGVQVIPVPVQANSSTSTHIGTQNIYTSKQQLMDRRSFGSGGVG